MPSDWRPGGIAVEGYDYPRGHIDPSCGTSRGCYAENMYRSPGYQRGYNPYMNTDPSFFESGEWNQECKRSYYDDDCGDGGCDPRYGGGYRGGSTYGGYGGGAYSGGAYGGYGGRGYTGYPGYSSSYYRSTYPTYYGSSGGYGGAGYGGGGYYSSPYDDDYQYSSSMPYRSARRDPIAPHKRRVRLPGSSRYRQSRGLGGLGRRGLGGGLLGSRRMMQSYDDEDWFDMEDEDEDYGAGYGRFNSSGLRGSGRFY